MASLVASHRRKILSTRSKSTYPNEHCHASIIIDGIFRRTPRHRRSTVRRCDFSNNYVYLYQFQCSMWVISVAIKLLFLSNVLSYILELHSWFCNTIVHGDNQFRNVRRAGNDPFHKSPFGVSGLWTVDSNDDNTQSGRFNWWKSTLMLVPYNNPNHTVTEETSMFYDSVQNEMDALVSMIFRTIRDPNYYLARSNCCRFSTTSSTNGFRGPDRFTWDQCLSNRIRIPHECVIASSFWMVDPMKLGILIPLVLQWGVDP